MPSSGLRLSLSLTHTHTHTHTHSYTHTHTHTHTHTAQTDISFSVSVECVDVFIGISPRLFSKGGSTMLDLVPSSSHSLLTVGEPRIGLMRRIISQEYMEIL